jgi:hypothetical protein
MKINWTNGSLRLQISQDELELLRSGGSVIEHLGAPGLGQWTAICSAEQVTGVIIDGGKLTISISSKDLEQLALPESERLFYDAGTEPGFRYSIEKNPSCPSPNTT